MSVNNQAPSSSNATVTNMIITLEFYSKYTSALREASKNEAYVKVKSEMLKIANYTEYYVQILNSNDTDTDPLLKAAAQVGLAGPCALMNEFMTAPTPQIIEITYRNFNFSVPLANAIPNENQKTRARKITDDTDSDEEHFKTPRKTAKATRLVDVEKTFKHKNRFEGLSDIEQDSDDEDITDRPTPAPKPEAFYILQTENWKIIIQKIFEEIEEKLPIRLKGDFVKTKRKTIDQFRKIQTFVIAQNIKCSYLNPKTNRPRKVLIKGLPIDTNIYDVKTELNTLGHEVQRIAQLRKYDNTTKTKKPRAY